jgi:hypothetical protein
VNFTTCFDVYSCDMWHNILLFLLLNKVIGVKATMWYIICKGSESYVGKMGFYISLVEKKFMGGEMSFRPLVRPHHSFTSLFLHPCDKF